MPSSGATLDLRSIIVEDQLGVTIARQWHQYNILRQPFIRDQEELRRYIYATDTSFTTNSKLPWKNKTTIPKLCQIRDNLYANYMAVLFPKRKFLFWLADNEDSDSKSKRDSILAYMTWTTAPGQAPFKSEMGKLVLDYIDYGNAFAMAEWIDRRVELPDRTQVGYVGPAPRRINPLDIVFNPAVNDFKRSPKIVRSLVSMGEVKELLTRLSVPENAEAYQKLWEYFKVIRANMSRVAMGGELRSYDDFYNVDGFTNFQMYLQSDYVELLTFYGDIYDRETDNFYKNVQIMVIDRHKVISMEPNPSNFGYPPIFHVGWRKRQDNLWAMGPLHNLVGLQYRLDHIENLKADIWDTVAFPVLKVKGYVEDFEWGPFERIMIGDDGDVEMVAPPYQVITQNNQEAQWIMQQMEEMAGSPKEAMGLRSPGEKTAYEVSRLENASSRIFGAKANQFEDFEEEILNGMLDCATRNMSEVQSITIYDDDFRIQQFMSLTPQDITGVGKIRPMAARHYAEKAEIVQNLNNFFASALGQDPDIKAHFMSINLAKMMVDLLDLQDYNLVVPFGRIAEHADANRLAQAAAEAVMMEAQTPSGLTPDDYSQHLADPSPGMAPGQPGAGAPQINTAPPPTRTASQKGPSETNLPPVPNIGPLAAA